jgi:hypothetical protein
MKMGEDAISKYEVVNHCEVLFLMLLLVLFWVIVTDLARWFFGLLSCFLQGFFVFFARVKVR